VSDELEDDPPVFTPPAAAVSAPRTRRISLGQPIHPPVGELLTVQRGEKVAMHPAVAAIQDGKLINNTCILNII